MRVAFYITCLLMPYMASAQTQPAAIAFGAREDVTDVSLSPDGSKVAFIGSRGPRGQTLYTMEMTAASTVVPRAVLNATGDPERLQQCQWVSNARLICRAYLTRRMGDRIETPSRLLAINADGSGLKVVSFKGTFFSTGQYNWGGAIIDLLPGDENAVLVGRQYVAESRIGSLIEKKESGYGVDRVDTSTLQTRRVERSDDNAGEYISDGVGNVRIKGTIAELAGGYSSTIVNYWYRKAGGGDWLPLSQYDAVADTGFNPYAVDPDANVAYGFERLDGRLALVKTSLDGTMRRETVFARPDVDVDGLVRIGRKQRVVGVSFATEKREVRYFDPALVKLGQSLVKAIPGAGLINFIEASADESKLVVWIGSDTAPGTYYLLDRKSGQMSELFPARPQLASYKLAEVKPVQIAVRGGVQVPGYLTLPTGSSGKGLPAIVMPHGGPSARDEWGFDWLVQYFANRGYAVLQPNYRGSSGYGDAWFQNNGFQSWETAIGDVTDAGRWLVQQGIAAPDKLAIVGWSYGGYAALQSGVVAPDLFKAIVAIAPVTDLANLKRDSRNYTNYRYVERFVGSGPHVSAGSPAQRAESIVAPVLMFHGALDQNVDISQARFMEGQLKRAGKRVELIEYPGLTHNLDDGQVRASLLERSDAFLRQAMGM